MLFSKFMMFSKFFSIKAMLINLLSIKDLAHHMYPRDP